MTSLAYSSERVNYVISFVFKNKEISHELFCLSDREQDRVPSTAKKLRLKSNGLGEKEIIFPITTDVESLSAHVNRQKPRASDET